MADDKPQSLRDRLEQLRELAINCLWSTEQAIEDVPRGWPPTRRHASTDGWMAQLLERDVEQFAERVERRLDYPAQDARRFADAQPWDLLDLICEANAGEIVTVGSEAFDTAHRAAYVLAERCGNVRREAGRVDPDGDRGWVEEVIRLLRGFSPLRNLEAAIRHEAALVLRLTEESEANAQPRGDAQPRRTIKSAEVERLTGVNRGTVHKATGEGKPIRRYDDGSLDLDDVLAWLKKNRPEAF